MNKIIAFFVVLFAVLHAGAADYALTPNSLYPQKLTVFGPFVDNATFTVDEGTAGDWTATISSSKANAGCSNRYGHCGTYYGRVDSVQLQNGLGTPIMDVPSDNASIPTFNFAATLAPGDYKLRITGAGAGTLLHAGQGWYFVASTAPKPPVVYTCEYFRGILQTQGYDDATVEMIIDGYKAQTPPVCVGD